MNFKKGTSTIVESTIAKVTDYTHPIAGQRPPLYRDYKDIEPHVAPLRLTDFTYLKKNWFFLLLLKYAGFLTIFSYPILSYPFLCFSTLSYPFLSFPILSFPFLSFPY